MAQFKAVAIGGVPATGKSTLMKAIIEKLKKTSSPTTWKFGLLNGLMFDNICIIGTYPAEQTFGGTDRLSMAAPKDMQKFMDWGERSILFEGDRLFTKNILENLLEKYDTKIIVLDCDEQTLNERHKARGDSQTEKFLKGRATKIQNILKSEAIKIRTEIYTLSRLKLTDDLADQVISFFRQS